MTVANRHPVTRVKRGLSEADHDFAHSEHDGWQALGSLPSRQLPLVGPGGGRFRRDEEMGTSRSSGERAVDGLAVSQELFAQELLGKALDDFRTTAYVSIKRVLDIVISSIAILLVSPLLLLSAVVIKLTDRGPVFYGHTRVGQDGREFQCYKFRSMVPDAEKVKSQILKLNAHDDHRTFKVPNDPRVTRVGFWLRRLSIDELPQLWNVLVGNMSLVGPRPPVPVEVAQYTPHDMRRLRVKPGLTCVWQVSGRSRIAFPEQLEMDLEYIANRSLWLDFKLLALTVPAVLTADGAY